jgi:hypothetical protein
VSYRETIMDALAAIVMPARQREAVIEKFHWAVKIVLATGR